MSKEEPGKYYPCPCNTCLVQPCCDEKCIRLYEFMNDTADNMDVFTYEEMRHYANNTPIKFRSIINEFIRSHERYDI